MGEDAWKGRISQPEYGISIDPDVRVPMRDGVELACDVYRPDQAGRYPALLAISPYGKDIQKVTRTAFPVSPIRGNGGQEAGDTEYFVQRGYVHVIADARGSGDSAGEYPFQGPQEHEDGYDLVEWIAAQPWCDGNVGMLGMSYFGVVQYLVAAQNPPHLKAIAPFEAYTDRYRHSAFHGGILNFGFFYHWWAHVSVGTLRPPVFKYLDEAEIEARLAALNESEEVISHPYLYITLKYREKNPLLFDFMMQPHDGPYYWDRSAHPRLDAIKVPTLLAVRWSAWAIHLPGAFAAWRAIQAPKKLILMETPSLHGPMRPWQENQDVIMRWYDHWLKGNDTGMMDEPPIRMFVKGSEVWRHEHEWPLARTAWRKFHLHAAGLLSADPPAASAPDEFENDPLLFPNQHPQGLDYATAPLEADLEITGPIALYLYAALDQPEATWIVTLRDVAPDGSARVVTKGWLRASHRALDPERSLPHQPYHPHRESVPVPLGEVCEYAIEIRETATVFKAGHRLLLAVRGQDSPAEDNLFFHQPNPQATKHTIHHDPEHPSHLLLPVIPG
ncbi:MAG: CocE/NonD family hydrolase [bacterium]